jgi:hypothetical protein
MEEKKVRLQLEVSEKRQGELQDLMEACDIGKQKDLFNAALTLLEWAVAERKKGRTIASIDEASMKYKELAMPALMAVHAAA